MTRHTGRTRRGGTHRLDERLGEPRANRKLFDLLERHGWIAAPPASSLRRMVGFRNVLVHGYNEVDLAIVRDVLTNHLVDLELFVETVRRRAAIAWGDTRGPQERTFVCEAAQGRWRSDSVGTTLSRMPATLCS